MTGANINHSSAVCPGVLGFYWALPSCFVVPAATRHLQRQLAVAGDLPSQTAMQFSYSDRNKPHWNKNPSFLQATWASVERASAHFRNATWRFQPVLTESSQVNVISFFFVRRAFSGVGPCDCDWQHNKTRQSHKWRLSQARENVAKSGGVYRHRLVVLAQYWPLFTPRNTFGRKL